MAVAQSAVPAGIPVACIELVKTFEGLRDGDLRRPGLQPYCCPAGYPTLGWGAIRDETGARVAMDHPGIDLEQAERLLARDLGTAAAAVSRFCPVPLGAGQYGALVSFTFNLGTAALQRSTLRQRVLDRDHAAVPEELLRWVRAGGRVLPGLVRRRAAEAALYRS